VQGCSQEQFFAIETLLTPGRVLWYNCVRMNNYTTVDHKLAATLLALGYKIKSYEEILEDGKRKIAFEFEGDGIKEQVLQYLSGELKMDPRNLFDSLTTIKNIIYETKRF